MDLWCTYLSTIEGGSGGDHERRSVVPACDNIWFSFLFSGCLRFDLYGSNRWLTNRGCQRPVHLHSINALCAYARQWPWFSHFYSFPLSHLDIGHLVFSWWQWRCDSNPKLTLFLAVCVSSLPPHSRLSPWNIFSPLLDFLLREWEKYFLIAYQQRNKPCSCRQWTVIFSNVFFISSLQYFVSVITVLFRSQQKHHAGSG